jgi:hypothetical protein
MKFRKWLPVLLIILGTVPFLAALILGLPVFRVSYLTYGEFLILWSYLFWPTYIFGVLLMLGGTVLTILRKKKEKLSCSTEK